jgi:hypothetical protein
MQEDSHFTSSLVEEGRVEAILPPQSAYTRDVKDDQEDGEFAL